MKVLKSFTKPALFALLLMSFIGIANAADGDYRFKVHNASSHTIKELLASEDGETYGKFDVGSGIAAGATVELVWDASTNTGSCHQHFKAVFDDGSETPAAKFDFCEPDLVLEFSD